MIQNMRNTISNVYLLLSIVVSILCPIFGLISLYHSIRAKKMENVDVELYKVELNKAYKWAQIAFIGFICIGGFFYVCLILLYNVSN